MICTPTRNALAPMVRAGLTAAAVGSALASATKRLENPRKRPSSSTGAVAASGPMRTVPTACENVSIRCS